MSTSPISEAGSPRPFISIWFPPYAAKISFAAVNACAWDFINGLFTDFVSLDAVELPDTIYCVLFPSFRVNTIAAISLFALIVG